jgi:hypothetical protein
MSLFRGGGGGSSKKKPSLTDRMNLPPLGVPCMSMQINPDLVSKGSKHAKEKTSWNSMVRPSGRVWHTQSPRFSVAQKCIHFQWPVLQSVGGRRCALCQRGRQFECGRHRLAAVGGDSSGGREEWEAVGGDSTEREETAGGRMDPNVARLIERTRARRAGLRDGPEGSPLPRCIQDSP